MKYKEIHIWDFPPIETYIKLKEKFRYNLLARFINQFQSENKAINYLNNQSRKYNLKRKYSRGMFFYWKKGYSGPNNQKKARTIPLWVLIEISKLITRSKTRNNKLMKEIERNIKYYNAISGSSRIYNPKLPIYLTPELISVIFHFCGDGHIGDKKTNSSYRQMNNEGLNNFLSKLNNIFGDFKYSENEFKLGKLYIPKIITKFYNYYFNLPNTNTFDAYIPNNIKSLPKNFLLAGLVSFVIDDGNIGEVIEIYSKNYRLIKDVGEIAIKCSYSCMPIKKKYRYGVFDSYRFLISSESYLNLAKDIEKLEIAFPLCNFAHKTKNFRILIKRKQRGLIKEKDGATRDKILRILSNSPKTTAELVEILNYGNSSIREHLGNLEKNNKTARFGKKGRNILWVAI